MRPEPAYAAYAAYAPSFHLRGAGAVSESEDGAEGADLAADP